MNLQSLALDVQAYTRERLPRYIEELRELCAIDSDSYHKPGLDEMASRLGSRLSDLGMQVRIIEQETWGNDLFGVLQGDGGVNVLLLGHMDTVYPVGTAVARPLRVDGDIVYGPGVSDMKGCILSAIYALEALQALNFHTYGELRFLCVSDEEINVRHSKDTLKQACQNCQAALVLEAARANGDIVSARKGGAVYTLTANGRAAHAGVEPAEGRNAIVEIAHQVLQFHRLNGWREGVTVNPGVISGGTMANVVPDYAQAQFDLRFLHPDDQAATEERWRQMLKQQLVLDVELDLASDPDQKMPMMRTPESLALAQQAQHIAHLLGFSVNHVLTGGASDASYTSSYGVPSLDGLGPIGGQDHSPGEYLVLSSVAPRTALLAGLVASTGAGT